MQQQAKLLFLLLTLTAMLQSCKDPGSEYDPCDEFTATIIQQGNTTLRAEATQGHLPLVYEWSNGVTLSETTVNSSGTYTVTVRDFSGCTATVSYNYTYIPSCSPATVTDSDGNTYDVVTIGTQCWMQQNLKVSAGIAEVADSMNWMTVTGAGNPAWCWPQNSSLNSGYGKLYNYYAIETGNLCPAGWHIPTVAEWQTLITYLGGDQLAGGAMKTEGTLYWDSPNGGATNSSAFSAVGAGDRSNQSLFGAFRLVGLYWSSTATQHTAKVFFMNSSSATILNSERTKQAAYSCRCVKD